MVSRKLNNIIHRHPSLTGLIVLVIVVIPGYIAVEHSINKNHDLAQCVDDWANGYQDRSTIVSKAVTYRQDALDDFLRSLSTTTPPKLYIDLANYIVATDPQVKQVALHLLQSDSKKFNQPAIHALHGYIKASDRYNRVLAHHPIGAVARKLNC